MASEKDRLEDIRQLLNSTAEGQEEQLAELLQDSDAMDDVRATVCLRQALLRRHSQDIMPQAEVSKELSKFRRRMGMKSQMMYKKQPETGRVATEQQ